MSVFYPYAQGNLLHERNTYFYSAYHGQATLTAWAESRENAASGIISASPATPTRTRLMQRLDRATLNHLVQRFEVTKRLHDDYTPAWRAVDKTRFEDLASYPLFAQILADAYQDTGGLPYLNALLKLNDTLTALGLLPPEIRARERRFLVELAGRVTPSDATSFSPQPWGSTPPAPRIVPGMAAILCNSARSKAYIQRLVSLGLLPERVIFLGDETRGTKTASPGRWEGLFLPDLGQAPTVTCTAAGIPVTHIKAANVNDPAVRAALQDHKVRVVLYAGLGGQIVSADTLNSGAQFLHMHSGWLPEYRGSTTLYYALLNGDMPAVSALWLDPQIDTGPVLARRAYPRPAPGMEVDQLYDASIRADLMGQIVSNIAQHGTDGLASDPLEGSECVYYVIHPVLKHVALLALSGQRARIPSA